VIKVRFLLVAEIELLEEVTYLSAVRARAACSSPHHIACVRGTGCPASSDGSYLDDVKPASMKNTGVDQAGRDDAGDG